MKYKTCTNCEAYLPLSEYYGRGDGKRSQCKKCVNKKRPSYDEIKKELANTRRSNSVMRNRSQEKNDTINHLKAEVDRLTKINKRLRDTIRDKEKSFDAATDPKLLRLLDGYEDIIKEIKSLRSQLKLMKMRELDRLVNEAS